ncbi:MAG TPA: D-aminoacyl-tRNA deacylase [Dehalococcoidia bacterium]|nr:D-aminoacyl-tRNA deacylase [Dehalococcoidia bacterium]
MRAVIQRASHASVAVDGRIVGSIGQGLLVLLGIEHSDDTATVERMADRVTGLRIFQDEDGRMNLSVQQVGGAVLCVSQFTLCGDVRRGRRPSFQAAAEPPVARGLYEEFCGAVERTSLVCERGEFGAHMEVELVNDGPVTIWIDSEDLNRPRR